jgi:hypothetical protein
MITLPAGERFLFLFPVNKVSKNCCCGCSLNTALLTLGIVDIIHCAILLLAVGSNPLAAIQILPQILAFGLLFSAKSKKDFSHANIGYIILTVSYYLKAIGLAFLLFMTPFFTNFYQLCQEMVSELGGHASVDSVYYTSLIIMSFYYILKTYFMFVIFSWVKLLKYKEHGVLDGLNREQNAVNITDNINAFSQI